MPTLTVELDDKEDAGMVLSLVAQKIGEGYTSGFGPDWKLEE